MLEVGDVGKKEQMSWEEIPLRNNASTNIRKEYQSCETVYTLEPEGSRVLDTKLHNQMLNNLLGCISQQWNIVPVF